MIDFNVTNREVLPLGPQWCLLVVCNVALEPSLLLHQEAPLAVLVHGRDGSITKGSSRYTDKAERVNSPLKIWQQTGFIANHFSAACKTKKLSEIPPS